MFINDNVVLMVQRSGEMSEMAYHFIKKNYHFVKSGQKVAKKHPKRMTRPFFIFYVSYNMK